MKHRFFVIMQEFCLVLTSTETDEKKIRQTITGSNKAILPRKVLCKLRRKTTGGNCKEMNYPDLENNNSFFQSGDIHTLRRLRKIDANYNQPGSWHVESYFSQLPMRIT
jgi:hypothetical protein